MNKTDKGYKIISSVFIRNGINSNSQQNRGSLKNIFTTAFFTGMCLNEILNMRWNWIDFTQDIITVKNSDDSKTKSKRERIIPIHQKIKSILLGYFPSGSQPKTDLVSYRKKKPQIKR